MTRIEDISYAQLTDALIAFAWRRGGEIRACEAYEDLADFFALAQHQRERRRPDGYRGNYWANRVQWARQKLINAGRMESGGRGVWRAIS